MLCVWLWHVGLYDRPSRESGTPYVTNPTRRWVGQGFLLTLMVSMAARLLPVYSADVLKRRRLLEVTLDLLLIGVLVRVSAEAIGGYTPLTGPLVALGGSLGVVGFAVFAVGMWSALGRLPRTAAANRPPTSGVR